MRIFGLLDNGQEAHLKTRWIAPFALVAWLLASGSYSLANSASPLEIQTFKTHSRLSLKADEGAVVDFKDTKGGFEIFFHGMTAADLGAPSGEETSWLKVVSRVQDERVGSLRIEETPQGLRLLGKWKFPSGESAPAKAIM